MATIALSTLRARLRIYLNDTNSKVWQDDDELDLFINHALVKFTHDMPRASAYTVTCESGTHAFDLPDDFVMDYFVRGYFESSGVEENISRMNIEPGAWEENDEPRGYVIDWPLEGQFYLPREPSGSTFTLYYGAFWNSWLTEDTDTFDLGRNRWGEQAVLAYSAYLAFNPSSARRAQLEQWNRRGDQNVGNPLEEEATRWLETYMELIGAHAEVPVTWQFMRSRAQ